MAKQLLLLISVLLFSACDSGTPSPEETPPTSIPMKDEWTGTWMYMDGASFRNDLTLKKDKTYLFETFQLVDNDEKQWYEDHGKVEITVPDTTRRDRHLVTFTRMGGSSKGGGPSKSFKEGETWQWLVSFSKDKITLHTPCVPYTSCTEVVYRKK